ncbi:hypothetical protein S40285_06449 [Stachybotrys chlorohalonatus IBT 40285]|uniref:KOW domain-containing protein n=1 Tax=Stachybotrys chlorohalonatus (strain IBT 40285) TaxID=1283841 RepID=A0A084QB82_STAC4|nr:hypothetical protein S40285_06449 [Stachybotrys chlorohalonata IBT 40285]
MQKLLKRANQAQRQAQRRATEVAKRDRINAINRNKESLRRANQEVRQNLRDSRQARQDAWELGPLAPKRDLGFNGYGLLKESARTDWSMDGRLSLKPELLEKRCAWAGGSKQLNLAPKDRVVILDGPDRGKIDRIKEINLAVGSVTLENCHQVMSAGLMGDQQYRAQPMPLPIDSIRLVHPITDPNTGVTRDVIINELKSVGSNMNSPHMTFDRWEYGKRWDRVVPSLNTVIPWPAVEPPKLTTHKIDTIRENVEDRTFFYSLLSPPMPESVIDELRGKYSRFRTRHDAEYVARKEAEAAAKKQTHEINKSMQTPLEEFHEKQRQLRAQEGEPELSDAMLEKIGEIIARKKKEALGNAGMTEVSPTSMPPTGGASSSTSAPGPL